MTQEDFFSDISNGTNASAARYWAYASGSPSSNASFVTGSLQAIELREGNGEVFVKRTSDAPLQVDQRCEVLIPLTTAVSGTARSGCFVRYVDANNYVLAYFDHVALTAYVYERTGGVSTLRATAPITAASDVTGVSLRVEVIGKRARLFFENHYRPIPDQPPDIAAYLDAEPVAGDWGIYLKGDATNSVKVSRWMARELPEACLPPPTLILNSADGYELAGFTASLTSVPSTAHSIEWEIYPVDIDDLPDPYRDLSLASMTSRVFYARPGYSYDVRARAVNKSGGYGDWVTQRVTMLGSKTLPTAETMPSLEFPDVVPDYVFGMTQAAEAQSCQSETGRERIRTNVPRPRMNFDLVFKSRTRDEIDLLQDFFRQTRGCLTPFSFTHPLSGVDYAVRFASDEFEPTAIDDLMDGTSAIYDLSLKLVEVAIGVISDITISLTVDSSLLPPEEP